jgi:hypothetical protein
MFWDSVVAGLTVLTYWETYVAVLEYLAIFMLPTIAAGFVVEKNPSAEGGIGCLSMLLLPVLQVAAIAVFTLTLAPIIFGLAHDASWGFPWRVIVLAPGAFFRLVGVLVVASIGLAFIPFLGQLQSLQTLVLGGLSLTFVLKLVGAINPSVGIERVDLIPNFWFTSGILIISAVLSRVGIVVAALVATIFEAENKGFTQLLIFPVAAMFGFIPVFIYGAWLGAQMKGGF